MNELYFRYFIKHTIIFNRLFNMLFKKNNFNYLINIIIIKYIIIIYFMFKIIIILT